MRALLAALVLLFAIAPAHAAEWDTVRPGESTQESVRAQFGSATKTSSKKVDGYDTAEWLYEGEAAPRGMTRATVAFGLLTPQGYRADVVREMVLEPRHGVFTRTAVVNGWGEPDVADVEGKAKVFRYRAGLFVYFDPAGWIAEKMYFTPPQTPREGATPPRR